MGSVNLYWWITQTYFRVAGTRTPLGQPLGHGHPCGGNNPFFRHPWLRWNPTKVTPCQHWSDKPPPLLRKKNFMNFQLLIYLIYRPLMLLSEIPNELNGCVNKIRTQYLLLVSYPFIWVTFANNEPRMEKIRRTVGELEKIHQRKWNRLVSNFLFKCGTFQESRIDEF